MKNQDETIETTERILRESYLHQVVPLPDEEWRRTVMARVRREPRPTRVVPVLTLERTAWRAGLATAVAASIFAIISLAAMPSKERLAWDLYKGGAMAQLSIRIGE